MNELNSWKEEMQSAYLYRVVAEAEPDKKRSMMFAQLAVEAEKQAQMWVEIIKKSGATAPQAYSADIRTRIVAKLIKIFGPTSLRSMLAAMKVRGLSVYSSIEPDHPMPQDMTQMERRHSGLSTGGNLRAAVFGINDGLVSNASLIMGVAGATSQHNTVLLAGIAGLCAGAFSMAAGEYVSVKSQREMYEYQIGLEREEFQQYPEEETEELALVYEARGLSKEEALQLAKKLMTNPESALNTLAREELGLNPDNLGSPWGAALFSFFSFAAGATIPLLPFFWKGESSLYISIALTTVALFGVGATISLFTGRQAFYGGLRMLLIGGAAGAITYLVGHLLGVSLS